MVGVFPRSICPITLPKEPDTVIESSSEPPVSAREVEGGGGGGGWTQLGVGVGGGVGSGTEGRAAPISVASAAVGTAVVVDLTAVVVDLFGTSDAGLPPNKLLRNPSEVPMPSAIKFPC